MSDRMLELKINWEKASKEPNYEKIVSSVPNNSSYDEQGKLAANELVYTIGPQPNSILLEFGSGPGRVTKHLSPHYGKIYAVDISNGMLDKLRSLNLPNVTCVENNGLSLVGKISPVNFIYSDLVFIHNSKTDVYKIFKHFNACLVSGGRIAFQLPVYDSPRKGNSWIDISIWTLQEIMNLAKGFIVEQLWKNPGKFSFDNIGTFHHKLHVFRKP